MASGIGGTFADIAGSTYNGTVTPAQFQAPQSNFQATAPTVSGATVQQPGWSASMSPANYQAAQAILSQIQQPGWSANNNFQFQAPTAQAGQSNYQFNVPNMQAAQNAYQAQQAQLALSGYGGAIGGLGGQGLGGGGPAQGTIGGQGTLANMLYQQALGNGPSPAQQLLQQGQNQNVQNAAGLIGAQRGINPGTAVRGILDAQTNANTQAAGQAALLRSQEQLNAQGLLGNTLNQMGGLQLGQQGMGIQGLGVAGGLQNAQNQALIQNLMQQQQLNQATAAQNAGMQQQAGLANQQAGLVGQQANLQQALANAGFNQQANLANAGFNLAAQQGQAGIASQNTANQQAAGLANLQASLGTNLANAQFQNAANAGNAQLQQAAGLANAGFQQQAALSNAGFQQQAGITNASNIMGAQGLNQLTGSQNVNSILNAMGLNSNQILGANNINANIGMFNAGAAGNAFGGILGGAAAMVPGFLGSGTAGNGSNGAYTAPQWGFGAHGGEVQGYSDGGEAGGDTGAYLSRAEQDALAQMIALNQGVMNQNNAMATPGLMAPQKSGGGGGGGQDILGTAMKLAPLAIAAFANKGGQVSKGKLKEDGKVTGKPKTAGDNEKNDTVNAKLSPGEIVLPRSVAQAPNAPEAARAFVAQLKSGNQGVNFASGGNVDYLGMLASKLGGGTPQGVQNASAAIQKGIDTHVFTPNEMAELAQLPSQALNRLQGLSPVQYNQVASIADIASGYKHPIAPYSVTHPDDQRNWNNEATVAPNSQGMPARDLLPNEKWYGMGPFGPWGGAGVKDMTGGNQGGGSSVNPASAFSSGAMPQGISGFWSPQAGTPGGPATISQTDMSYPTVPGGYNPGAQGKGGSGSAIGSILGGGLNAGIGSGIGGAAFGPIGSFIGALPGIGQAVGGIGGAIGDAAGAVGDFFGGLFAQGGEVPNGDTKLSKGFVNAIRSKYSNGSDYGKVVSTRTKAKRAKRAS